jgi:copper chaperone
METVNLKITGMTCDHCVMAVTRALESCDGVTSAEVSLASASAVVKGDDFDPECLIRSVEAAGYGASISE